MATTCNLSYSDISTTTDLPGQPTSLLPQTFTLVVPTRSMSREDYRVTGADPALAEEKALPTTRDETARIRAIARLMDSSITIPGTGFRIGLDPILGILPGAGDAVSAVLSIYIVVESARLGVSNFTLARMLVNVGLDFVGGSIPVLGTIFDASWKANQRNVKLALRELDIDPDTSERVDLTGF